MICSLLRQLKDTCVQMQELAAEMSGSADLYLEKAFLESHEEIMTLVEEYNENIRQSEEITRQITGRMNEWVSFAANEKNLSAFLFPLRYFFEKREVKKFIGRSREQISEKVIRNRFIREALTAMEEKLCCRAVLKIESEEKYQAFNELTNLKKELLEHLRYLMPTIPEFCPVQFTMEDIDHLILKFSSAG